MATDVTSGVAAAEQAAADSLRATTRILGRALRALALAGRADEASELAAEAWARLREDAPAEAARLTALLHGLTRIADRDAPTAKEAQGGEAPVADLDVRNDAPARRHERIFETFTGLAAGNAFILVNDHDPKPLYYQFAAEHAGEFEWQALEEGPQTWRIRIGRPAVTATPLPRRSAAVPIVELENLATLVLEGLRTRGARTVQVTGAEAVDAWVKLNEILRPGQVGDEEPVWLARLLLAIADALDAAAHSRSAPHVN